MLRPTIRSLALAAALSLVPSLTAAAPRAVVFLLLDTTRADRVSAWGHIAGATPALDDLAADGVRFARHYANSHATRPSMPQLMTGRYYHQNILREFTPDEHPREFPFTRPDPTAVLLPSVLADRGWQLLGASAHPWVVADSAFGRPFERLELVPASPPAPHADAAAVADAGIAAWRRRDLTRPLFLYLHFMDAHMPRDLRPGEAIDVADPGRFRADGEPAFDRERRRWAWARENTTIVWTVGGALVAVAVLGLGLGWYRARQSDAAAVRFQSAHTEFAAQKYQEAAEAFAGLGRDYGSTPFGRLAELYRGHSLLRANDAAGAATAYGEYLASSPETEYLRQEALTGQAAAREATGDTAGAVQAYTDAAAIDGPFRSDARLALARLAEASGKPDEAKDIYRTLLKESPNEQIRAFLMAKLPGETVAPAAAPAP